MKKIFSVFIAAIFTLLSVLPVFAAQAGSTEQAPFVLVSGMGYKPLVMNIGTDNQQSVFPPVINTEDLILPIAKGLFSAVGSGWLGFGNHLLPAAYDILQYAACDDNGDSAYEVLPYTYPKSMAHYPEVAGAHSSEGGLIHSACDKIGADNVYYFNYDWRLSPMVNAAYLDAYINNVKFEKSCEKVDLAVLSMGGIVTLTYFQMFGTASVKSCVLLCSTYSGVQLASDAMSLRLGVDKDDLLNYLPQNFGTAQTKAAMIAAFKLLDMLGIADAIVNFVNEGLAALLDSFTEEIMKEIFLTMPGLWAVVRQEDYEAAKTSLLDPQKHAGLIERIDYVQYNVHQKRKEILQSAMADGVKVAFVANYNLAPAPVYASSSFHSDTLIETARASGGATCAPLGTTLPAGYVQQNACSGHNHISPDNIIDASTADFPDQVWFVKNVGHVRCLYGSDYNEFLLWLNHQPTQPTVLTNPDYPQFMGSDNDGMTLYRIEHVEQSKTLFDYLLSFIKMITATNLPFLKY